MIVSSAKTKLKIQLSPKLTKNHFHCNTQSGHGHASMKRIHYQEGKFAVGSILCALVPKNEEVANDRFLYNYLHFQRESILVPLMRGATNVSLSIKSISSVEINLPPIETQISINKLVDDFKLKQDIFQTELKPNPISSANSAKPICRRQ